MPDLERCSVSVFTALAYPIQRYGEWSPASCGIVPYVGTLVAATLPLALSLAVFDGWLRPLLVFLLVASLELIVANFVEPWLYGTHVGISSLALLVTAVFWTVLWGPAGLILSTPLTVCVVVLGRYVPQLSFLHILLGDEPVLAAEAQTLPAVTRDGSTGSTGHCRPVFSKEGPWWSCTTRC